MRHTFGKVLIGFAVLASGSAGATLAVVTAGSSAAANPPASTAAVTSAAASGASAPAAANAPAAVSQPAAAEAPAFAPALTPAFPQGRAGRAFPMATTPTSTANCPNMGSHPHGGTPTATATPGT